jgi:hypothetical protein
MPRTLKAPAFLKLSNQMGHVSVISSLPISVRLRHLLAPFTVCFVAMPIFLSQLNRVRAPRLLSPHMAAVAHLQASIRADPRPVPPSPAYPDRRPATRATRRASTISSSRSCELEWCCNLVADEDSASQCATAHPAGCTRCSIYDAQIGLDIARRGTLWRRCPIGNLIPYCIGHRRVFGPPDFF